MLKVHEYSLTIGSSFEAVIWNVDDFISEFDGEIGEIASIKKKEALDKSQARLEVNINICR